MCVSLLYVNDIGSRLTSGSGVSTYPADRDLKGHVGGVRGAAARNFFIFFHIFRIFLSDFQEEKGDTCTNEYITNFRIRLFLMVNGKFSPGNLFYYIRPGVKRVKWRGRGEGSFS